MAPGPACPVTSSLWLPQHQAALPTGTQAGTGAPPRPSTLGKARSTPWGRHEAPAAPCLQLPGGPNLSNRHITQPHASQHTQHHAGRHYNSQNPHVCNFTGFRCNISCACRALCNRLSTTGRQSSYLRPATSPRVQPRRSSHTGISLTCHSQLLHARLKSAALITLFVGDSRLVCLAACRMRRGECFAAPGKHSLVQQLSEEREARQGPATPTRLPARIDALLDSEAMSISATQRIKIGLIDAPVPALTPSKKPGGVPAFPSCSGAWHKG